MTRTALCLCVFALFGAACAEDPVYEAPEEPNNAPNNQPNNDPNNDPNNTPNNQPNNTPNNDPPPVDGCVALDEAACAADPACRPILGAPGDEICVEDFSNWVSVFGGCMASDFGCGDAETCAVDPRTGHRFVFPSTCLPEGWSPCRSDCQVLGECAEGGALAEIGGFCLRGEPAGGVERVEAGSLRFEVFPAGCFSSSCTTHKDVFCRVEISEDGILDVGANFCLGGPEDPMSPCTDDCGGGGQARCLSQAVSAGAHVALLGALRLEFEVPGEVPAGGACVGERF